MLVMLMACSVHASISAPATTTGPFTVSWTESATRFQLRESRDAGATWSVIYEGAAPRVDLDARAVGTYQYNVALCVEDIGDPKCMLVSGRGELHLSVLIETMRRENYELAVSRPQVITKVIDGVENEPFEELILDIEEKHQGFAMEELGKRRGELLNMVLDGRGRMRLSYRIASRALMGYRSMFLSGTSGTGIMAHSFAGYGPLVEGDPGSRANGVLIANDTGRSVAFALFSLQDRGRMFVGPNEDIYEGMVVGIHARDNDLTVNPLKEKKLTNMRASGSDENVILTPPLRYSLEQALEFIDDDELVEITPKVIRIRKKLLKETDRRRDSRQRA